MLHEMKLHEDPFNSIKNGTKTIEMRMFDEKRKLIQVGDKIIFSLYSDNSRSIVVEVINLHKFNNFSELYSNFNKISLGYSKDEIADPKDMEKYYSQEEQSKHGVLAIEINLI